ncbi:DUF1353 domain-containing protein [Pseudomonas extremaustralis]|uniref:DUF1353 domain-containing protein n=1 Tax=Pseudomonas extremaustralis TaxID=359110 RepID=UPI0023081163|nr:DUF1353 domain-containing protein [Pseudomonas extremaustralis]MDB1109697.1 DUF1353 domain-containing protein [Pseudomonas extremaustralis]
MGRFQETLRAELAINGGNARLLCDFTYEDHRCGTISVPAGFETDFASVKPLRTIAWGLLALSLSAGLFWPEVGAGIGSAGYGALALYASVVGYGDAAATVHDWLYSTGQLSRKESDQVFHSALCASGVARWRAWMMWAGVRIGGHWRYRRMER